MSNFLVSSFTRWVADDFEEPVRHHGLHLIRDYGLSLPPVAPSEIAGLWMPAGHATRLKLSGYEVPWTAPGPQWINTVPEELTGRHIQTMRANEVHNPQDGFWKIAEAKWDGFPSEWRTGTAVQALLPSLDPTTWLQWTPTYLDIVNESRFFVVYNPETRAWTLNGSMYLEGEWIYYDDLVVKNDDKATEFAESILSALQPFSPLGYVLDVATLRNGQHVVLEANPAWCSAAYAADMNHVVESIMASLSPTNSYEHMWVPDGILLKQEGRKRLLTP